MKTALGHTDGEARCGDGADGRDSTFIPCADEAGVLFALVVAREWRGRAVVEGRTWRGVRCVDGEVGSCSREIDGGPLAFLYYGAPAGTRAYVVPG